MLQNESLFTEANEEVHSPLLSMLSFNQQHQARHLAVRLQRKDEDILQFGFPVQQHIAEISNQLLLYMKRKDIEHAGEILQQLTEQLMMMNVDELSQPKQSFFRKLFGKAPMTFQQVKTNLQRTSVQIDRLHIRLAQLQQRLLDELTILDELYRTSQTCSEEIIVYIVAVELTQQQLLQAFSENLLTSEQYAHTEKMERLNQRLYDLQVSRQLTLQTGPQIRLIQENYKQLAEKIQTSILSTIPLWKNQLSMLFSHKTTVMQQQLTRTSQQFMKKHKQLSDTTIHVEQVQANKQLHALKEIQQTLLQMIDDTLQLTLQNNKDANE